MSAYSLTTLTPCRRSCSLCMQTYAEIVVDYADTVSALSKTTRTRTRLRRHFQKTLKASHRFYRNIQLKMVVGCVYKLQSLYCSNNLKIRKCPYLKKNLRVCLVNDYADYADTQFSNFTIEYLGKKRKRLRNRFCLFIWGPGRIFQAKKIVENLVSLSRHCKSYSPPICWGEK